MENPKFNTPEKHSLDSMEGVGDIKKPESANLNSLEISPEVEKIVMQKVKDIFEYGQAITALGGQDVKRQKSREVPWSISNIRKYFSFDEGMNMPAKINSIFKYGIQSKMYVPRGTDPIAKNYLEYRNKNRLVDKYINEEYSSIDSAKLDSVFFHIEGRSLPERKEYSGTGFCDIAIMFELPKDTFIIDQTSEKTKQIFGKEVREEDDDKGIVKKRLKFGEFSTSPWHWPADTFSFFKNNPNLEIRDERIKEKVREIEESEPKPRYGFHDHFNNKGDFIIMNSNALGEGFMTPKRIPPRKFQGMIVGSPKAVEVLYEDIVESGENISDEELYNRTLEFREKLVAKDENALRKHFTNLVQKGVNTMLYACQNNPKGLVPVYDRFGNLLWPQKLSHGEIVKTKETEKAQDAQG